jgi:acyl carrier protein
MQNQNITSEEVRTEIKRLVAEVTESEPEKIGDQDNYLLDLDLDSLMALEVMVTLSKQYRIEIPEEEFSRLQNVDDTVKLVMFYLERAGRAAGVPQLV